MAPDRETIEARTCERVGANIYGRVKMFLKHAEEGDDLGARRELLALLRFFPLSKKGVK
jgi:hypothetical protein